MAPKKARAKAVKHKAAAPRKAADRRRRPAHAKSAARRPAAKPRKAAPARKPAKTQAKAPPKAPAKAPSKTPEKPRIWEKHAARTAERSMAPERPRISAPSVNVPLRSVGPFAATEAEETEGDAGASLLAGPRNVKPYIAKRGEQYMNKEQLGHFRHILMNWKRDLMEEVDRTVLHMKDEAANFPDPNDRATQESEFSLELRTRDRERKLIRKIEEALKRIDDGTYGYCLETGEEIGIKRLEARPVATLSVEAQERRERREKQFGDRDDRYR
jgi:DnaK suppressor protein